VHDIVDAKVRLLEMHHVAGTGHIGGNLSSLDVLMLLFHEFISPDDFFVLSKGHCAGALYVTLSTVGIIDVEELSTFHKDGTRLTGHPTESLSNRIIFSTGSLGHGLSLAVGTGYALSLAKKPGRVFCLLSDGELQEGSTWEALVFLNHLGLTNVTVVIDDNGLQGFGSTRSVASMDPVERRLEGFDLQRVVVNGHSLDELRSALGNRPHGVARPLVLIAKTMKGNGVSFMEGKMEWHYLPLTDDEFRSALKELRSKI